MSNELKRLTDNIKSLIEVTRIPVDTQYNAKSVNAQSGVAVAEAISEIPVLASDTDVTSVVMNHESNIAGSFGFNVIEGYSEIIDDVTYGYYKVDMVLTVEEDLLKAIEDFNNAMTELESNNELTKEEKLKQRQVSMYLFKTETDSHRFDAASVYIDAIINTNGYWQIKTQGFNSYSASEGTIKEFVSGSYIRIINYPNIGTVNVDGYSFAAGINSRALGDASFSVGRNNTSNGAYSATFGRDNTVAYNGAAFGRYNTVGGQIGTVFGQHNKITGHDGLAAGLFNLAEGTENSTFGIKNIATGEAQTVVGKANEKDNDAYFIVGNGKTDRTEGTSIERSNAFVVKKDGNAEVQGDLIVKGQNILEVQSISEIVSELPEIGCKDKIYIVDKSEYVYVSKPDSKKSEIWSGKLAEGFSKGSGTKDDPYIIETAEELATAVNGVILTLKEKSVLDLFLYNASSNLYIGDYTSLPAGNYTITLINSNATVEVSYGYASSSGDIFTLDENNIEQTFTIYSNPSSSGHGLTITGNSADFTITYNNDSKVEIQESVDVTNAYFKLSNNIYLNDVTKLDWYNNASNTPWFKGAFQKYYVKDTDGNNTEETTTFLGHIDGNGYCVYGVWYTDDSNTSSLIPVASAGTTIKNLGLDKSYIKSIKVDDYRGWAAGFVADTVTGPITFENCYVGKDVYILSTYSQACAAGFLGYARKNTASTLYTLTNCYNLMPTSHYAGQNTKRNGLIGEMYQTNVNITNCYSIASGYQGSGDAAPIGTLTNVIGDLTEEQLKTLDMGEAFYNNGTYPKLTNFGYWEQISSAAAGSEAVRIWDGSVVTEFAGGDGTSTNPYLIETPEQFALMVENFGSAFYYKIINDLYFNDTSLDKSEWTNTDWYCKDEATTEDTQSNPEYYYYNKAGDLGTFNGYIDGDGHSIIGLYHKDTTHYTVGLIPSMGNGYIKNLAIKNSELNATGNVGAFIGRTSRYGYISTGVIDVENCYVDSDVIVKSSSAGAGGIIGYTVLQTLNIKNCYCLTTFISGGSSKTAAFVGESWSSPHNITNCYSILQPVTQDNVARKPTTCTNVYSTVADGKFGGIWTQISHPNMQGLDVLNNSFKMPGLIDEFVITSTYPTLKVFVSEVEATASDAYVKAYNGYTKNEVDTKLENYQEQIATVTKEGELTTGISLLVSAQEDLADTAQLKLDKTTADLLTYGQTTITTHNGDIVLNPNQNVNVSSSQIKNVAAPTEDADAVNKKYVDDLIAQLKTELSL